MHTAPVRRSSRRRSTALGACLLVVFAAVTAALHQGVQASSSSTVVSPFDDTTPTVSRLDPALLDALRRAATDAGGDGVELHVTSGWRSARHQARLLREAVSEYGSKAEAARWVATAATSPHVSGNAIDVGHSDATEWLSAHGAAYGLCQIYGNEPWHFELRPAAVRLGCAPTYADPTHDPRMQP